MKHLNLKITGRVQGVFFRHGAVYKATELGIKGFIKNEPDGSVYIEAEAEVHALDKFVEWCRSGPPFAQVDEVKISPGRLKNFPGFEILE